MSGSGKIFNKVNLRYLLQNDGFNIFLVLRHSRLALPSGRNDLNWTYIRKTSSLCPNCDMDWSDIYFAQVM